MKNINPKYCNVNVFTEKTHCTGVFTSATALGAAERLVIKFDSIGWYVTVSDVVRHGKSYDAANRNI